MKYLKALLTHLIVRRALWGVLALIHIAPLLSTTRALLGGGVEASSLVSCAVLWLVFAFFALKFLDVAFLRWRMNSTTVLAFFLACALAHQDPSGTSATKGMLAELPTAVAMSLLWESLA